MNVNKAILVGNITRDPELKSLPSGQKVATFSIATNKTYKDKDGNQQSSTEYHNIVAWGKTAENIATWMKKGSQIYIEGELQTRSWDDTESGKKMYRTEVVAHNVQFGSKPSGEGKQSAPEGEDRDVPPDHKTGSAEQDINPEDIPF